MDRTSFNSGVQKSPLLSRGLRERVKLKEKENKEGHKTCPDYSNSPTLPLSIHSRPLLSIICSVLFSSVAQLCPTLCDPMNRSTPDHPFHHHCRSLLKPMSIELVMPSNHLILWRPLLILPSIFPSIRVFSNESLSASGGQSIGVSASTSVLPMNTQDWSLGWTGWIFAVQETFKSLLQHHSLKASILQCSALFIVQLSCPYMTTGETTALIDGPPQEKKKKKRPKGIYKTN